MIYLYTKKFTYMCFGRQSCDHVVTMLKICLLHIPFLLYKKNSIPYIPEPVFVVIYRQENNGCLGLNGISP